jgi:hypothetical protein
LTMPRLINPVPPMTSARMAAILPPAILVRCRSRR